MERQKHRSLLGLPLQDFAVLAVLWIYLYFFIETKLIYHGAGRILFFPEFYLKWSYFLSFLSIPGGLAEYFNAFVSQFFYYNWLGATAITTICGLNSVFAYYILSKLKLARFDFIRFVVLIVTCIMFGRYQYYFQFITAFTLVQAFTCLYFIVCPTRQLLNLISLIVLSMVAYVATGAAFYIFVLLAIVYMLNRGLHIKYILIYAGSAIIIPYFVGVVVLQDALNNAYSNLMPFSWKITIYIPKKSELALLYPLYFILPAISLVSLIKPARVKKKDENASTRKSRLKAIYYICIWLAILVVITAGFYDPVKKQKIAIDYYETRGDWHAVLKIAKKFEGPNFYVSHAVNHALSQLGTLSSEMFDYSQHPYGLFLTSPAHKMVHWAKIDVLMDLGFMNFAEQEIREAISIIGTRPFLIKRLITVYLVNGNYEAAKTYLNQLSETIFEKKWAREYLEQLDHDPELEDNSRIQYMRSIKLEKEGGFFGFDFRDILADSVASNPGNKMAFEYLMAMNMLTGDLQSVAQRLDQVGHYNNGKIPMYYQQAYLFYKGMQKGKVSVNDIKFDAGVVKQYKDFAKHLKLLQIGDGGVYSVMMEKFKGTYYLYYLSLPSLMGR